MGSEPNELLKIVTTIASGDLTVALDDTRQVGVYGAMVSMQQQQQLVSVVQQIQGNSDQISSAAVQVSDTANSLSEAGRLFPKRCLL